MSTTPFTWQTASFTGSIAGAILSVGPTAPTGTLANGNALFGGGILAPATVGSQLTGPTGGTGTYNVSGISPLIQSRGIPAEVMTAGANYTTGTGASQVLTAPSNAKQASIVAWMGATAGNATIQVLGATDATNYVNLGTIMLTGANAVAGFTMPSFETLFYDSIKLNVTANTGQVAGSVRYR
jgi:hypothetical protein